MAKSAAILGASAAVALGAGLASPAHAAGVIGSVSGNTAVVSGVTTVTVSGTTLSPAAGKDYYLGVCSTASYTFGIPACTWYVTVDTSSAPSFSESFTPDVISDNAHFGVMPDQPSQIDCSAPGSCIIALAEHDGTTGGSTVIGTESITFV